MFFGDRYKSDQLAGYAYNLMTRSKYNESIAECDYIIEHDNRFWLPYYIKGICVLQDSLYDEAFTLFDQASSCYIEGGKYYQIGPDTLDASNIYAMMGITLFDKYAESEEIDSLQKAINYCELAVSSGIIASYVEKNCLVTLCRTYCMMNQPEMVKMWAKRLAHKDRNLGNCYIGMAEQLAGNYEKAIEYYEESYGNSVDSVALKNAVQQCRDSLLSHCYR